MSRANWKGPYVKKPKFIKQQLEVSRSSKIVPHFTGLTCVIHNGQNFKELLVTKDMVGHKFGEFFNTKAKYVFKKKKQKQKSKILKWDKK